jgi:hypothetical protein
MTREESWGVSSVTFTLLRHVSAKGYTVSVFRYPSSLLHTRPGRVEMHATDFSTDPPTQHICRILDTESGDLDYLCACALAEVVGIEIDDG